MTRLARTLALFSVALAAPAAQAQEWTMFQGAPGRPASVPGPALAGGAPVWQHPTALTEPIHTAFALMDGAAVALGILLSDDLQSFTTAITRFDPATGIADWSIERTDGDTVFWVAVAGDKVVYATTSDGPNGDTVGPYEDRLVALQLTDGQEAWSYSIGDTVVFQGITQAAVLGGEIVFTARLASGDLDLIRLDASDGTETSRTTLVNADSSVLRAIALGDDGWAYLGGTAVAAYDHDGIERWRKPATNAYRNTPIVAEGRVFAGSVGRFVDVFDAATGDPLGHWDNPNGASINNDMVYDSAQDQLYVFDNKGVFALDRDAAEQWYRPWTDGYTPVGIIGGGGELYAYGNRSYEDALGTAVQSGDLIAFSAGGAKLWTAEIGELFSPQPALAAGRLVMTTFVKRGSDFEFYFSAFGAIPDDPLLVCQADLAVCLADTDVCEGDLQTCQSGADACGADLTQCQSDGATCASSLTTCEGDHDQCQGDLGACETDNAQLTTDLGTCATAKTQCLDDLGLCTADLSQTADDLAACDGSLGTCDADLGQCQADVTTCEDDLAASDAAKQQAEAALALCEGDRDALEIEVADLTAEAAGLAAAIAECQADQGALAAELAARMEELRDFMRTALRDPSYDIPGATPSEELANLVRAIARLPPGAAYLLEAALAGETPTR